MSQWLKKEKLEQVDWIQNLYANVQTALGEKLYYLFSFNLELWANG